jgi:hypothetical protein
LTDKVLFRPKNPTNKPINVELWGFDIETETAKNKFTLCAFANDEERVICRSIKEIIEFLDSHPKIVCIATNLAFDFYGVFAEISDNWEILDRDGRLLTASYYPQGDEKKVIKFYDTFSYVPFSVENLGKQVKIEKMQHPECFNTRPTSEKDWKELEDYCINDAIISYTFFRDFVIKFCNEYRVKLSPTISGIAMNIFQTLFLYETFENSVVNETFIRSAYFGGRCETFKRGSNFIGKNGNIEVFCGDVNSLYPYISSIIELPNPNSEKVKEQGDLETIKRFCGFSYIEGFQPPVYVPILPVRNPLDNDKLIFPTGKVKGIYSNYEILFAIRELGFKLEKVGKCVYWTETKPYLAEYMKHFYKLRNKQKKDKDPNELMTKSVLNNLTGRFGLNWKSNKTLIPEVQFLKKENKYIISFVPYTYGDNTFYSVEEVKDTQPPYAIVAWIALITSYSRVHLTKTLIKHQDNLIYCDTDSIFLFNGDKVETSDKLGDFKEEYLDFKNPVFIRPKVYLTDKSVKWKGFKFRDIKDKSGNIIKTRRDQFIETMSADKRTEERFAKIKTAVKVKQHHKLAGVKINERYDVTKKVNLDDTKRTWFKPFSTDYWSDSNPIHLDEDSFKKPKKVNSKMLIKAYTEQRYKDLISSDEFDINAVGEDIDPMEYLNNEMSKEFF